MSHTPNNLPEDTKQFIRKVVKEIQAVKFEANMSYKDMLNKFYDIMLKYGIKQGELSENGRTINNPEWIVFLNIFEQSVRGRMTMWNLLNNPPKELLHY